MAASEVSWPDVRLAVDCGAVWTRAAVGWSGGGGRLVAFGGLSGLPSGVVVRADGTVLVGFAHDRPAVAGSPASGGEGAARLVRAPIDTLADGQLHTTGDVAVEPVKLVAAVLRQVMVEATAVARQRPSVVCLLVPAGWGPRRRTLVRQCAHRAGIGEVMLMETPIAVARRLEATGVPLPVGSWLAVCDLGSGFTASVVARTVEGFEVLSTVDAPAGGHRLDEAFARRLLDLTATAEPVMAAAVAATRQAIEAAMVDPGSCAGIFLVGGEAKSPVVTAGFERGLADVAAVQVVAQPQEAAVLGAAGVVDAGDGAPPPAPPAPEPPKVTQAIGLAVPLVAALVVAVHFFATTTVERQRGLSVSAQVIANWGELALACLFGLLGCLSGATLVASALPAASAGPGGLVGLRRGRRVLELDGGRRPSLAADDPTNAGARSTPTEGDSSTVPAAVLARQVATGLFAAMALGLTLAGVLAVFGAVGAGVSNGSYLRWALLPLLPVAAAAALCGLLVAWRRVTPVRGWHAFLVFPPASVVCAAIGTVLVQYSMVTPVYPGQGPLVAIVGRGGGALF